MEPLQPPSFAASFPYLTLGSFFPVASWAPPACQQHGFGWGRGFWYGTGPVCGDSGRARGYLVALTARLCYEDIAAGEWHKDGCAGIALSLFWLWLFPTVPGSCGAFGGGGKFKLPFWGRLDQREVVVRLSRECGYPGMQILDLTMGRRAVPSKYPPAVRSLVPVPCILVREIILHLSPRKHSLGCGQDREALGRPPSKALEQPGSVPPWHGGWHGGTRTRAKARAASRANGDPSCCPLHRCGDVSVNAFTLPA